MISFIIIGRNEGWKLPNCVKSIINTCNFNKIDNYEIIYVDSNSTDGSLEEMRAFDSIQVFKLTGEINAAIARNIGASEAKGDIFFFIDGDMEINKESFNEIFDDDMNLKYEFISGDFENYYYHNNSKELISKEMYHKNNVLISDFITGGLFAINKSKWILVNGMRNTFRRSQDMDLGLRLSKKNIYLHRLPINLAKHHTESYSSRLWNQLKDDTHLYGRALLYRSNIWNLNSLRLMIKQDYSLIVLIITILLILVFQNKDFILLYGLILIIRTLLKKKIKYFVYYVLRDLKVLLGFIFFHPKNRKISYVKIQ